MACVLVAMLYFSSGMLVGLMVGWMGVQITLEALSQLTDTSDYGVVQESLGDVGHGGALGQAVVRPDDRQAPGGDPCTRRRAKAMALALASLIAV